MQHPTSRSRGDLIEPISLIAAALECDPTSISAGCGLDRHPNWDSFGHLAIMVALEKHYGVTIDDATIRQFESLEAIESRYAQLVRELPTT